MLLAQHITTTSREETAFHDNNSHKLLRFKFNIAKGAIKSVQTLATMLQTKAKAKEKIVYLLRGLSI